MVEAYIILEVVGIPMSKLYQLLEKPWRLLTMIIWSPVLDLEMVFYDKIVFFFLKFCNLAF